MTETFARLTDRLVNSGNESRDVFRTLDGSLNYGKFVTAESGNDISLIETISQASRQ